MYKLNDDFCILNLSRFELKYNHYKLKERRKELRNNTTRAESMLWERLRKNQILGTKFRRQFSIDNYVVDFFSTEFKLVVELDGVTHQTIDEKENDRVRQNCLENVDLVFLRFTNSEVFSDIDKVVEQIKAKIIELKSKTNISPN